AFIKYDADLIGTVDAAPTGSGGTFAFSVYGLGVTTATDTIFDGVLSASGLAAGDTVEVSGLLNIGTGTILAKRVQRKATSTPLQLTGSISNVTATSFTLGSLTVDYAGATLKGIPSGGLSTGLRVRIKAPAQTTTGTVSATNVQGAQNDAAEGEGLEADLQGVVANLSNGSFNLGGMLVVTSSATLYVNGTAVNLANGAEVEVDGQILNGVFNAGSVSFPKPEPVSLTGQVVARSGDTLTVFGANGVRVLVTADTRMNDNTGVIKSRFSVSDIHAGDRVIVKGNPDDNLVVVAISLVRTKADPAVDITGRVGKASALDLIILNQAVHTAAAIKFSDAKGHPLTAEAFYAQVAGHTSLVKGTAVNGVIEASRADIQP
ncbi:MAG: DUF5666 domain-containing protein, partial [Pseudomonadota bacterium]